MADPRAVFAPTGSDLAVLEQRHGHLEQPGVPLAGPPQVARLVALVVVDPGVGQEQPAVARLQDPCLEVVVLRGDAAVEAELVEDARPPGAVAKRQVGDVPGDQVLVDRPLEQLHVPLDRVRRWLERPGGAPAVQRRPRLDRGDDLLKPPFRRHLVRVEEDRRRFAQEAHRRNPRIDRTASEPNQLDLEGRLAGERRVRERRRGEGGRRDEHAVRPALLRGEGVERPEQPRIVLHGDLDDDLPPAGWGPGLWHRGASLLRSSTVGRRAARRSCGRPPGCW